MILSKEDLIAKVEHSLNSIRPHLETDGGNIEVVDITEENVVQVRLLGNCDGCPMSAMTMKAGVEQAILNAVPEVAGVEPVN